MTTLWYLISRMLAVSLFWRIILCKELKLLLSVIMIFLCVYISLIQKLYNNKPFVNSLPQPYPPTFDLIIETAIKVFESKCNSHTTLMPHLYTLCICKIIVTVCTDPYPLPPQKSTTQWCIPLLTNCTKLVSFGTIKTQGYQCWCDCRQSRQRAYKLTGWFHCEPSLSTALTSVRGSRSTCCLSSKESKQLQQIQPTCCWVAFICGMSCHLDFISTTSTHF